MSSRREFLAFGVRMTALGCVSGCVSLHNLQPNCPIDWAPSLLEPVFHGFREYADPAVRVYFPSLDGSPQNAQILLMCERFPLVILVHGDCGGAPFNQWISLPAQLARSGYVVAVTSFGGVLATGDHASTAPLRAVHDWMRNGWEYRDRVMPPPNTAVVGHSFGGTLGAQLVTEITVSAFASLSGVFGQFTNPPAALSAIRVPGLYLWNDVDDASLGAQLFHPGGSSSGMWGSIAAPKHGVILEGGNHGDYLEAGSTSSCSRQGTCSAVRPIANDFVTTFLTKYVSPQFAFAARTWVPESLFVKPQSLPPPSANGFYAGSYLIGFESSVQSSTHGQKPCEQRVLWETSVSSGTVFVMPG